MFPRVYRMGILLIEINFTCAEFIIRSEMIDFIYKMKSKSGTFGIT